MRGLGLELHRQHQNRPQAGRGKGVLLGDSRHREEEGVDLRAEVAASDLLAVQRRKYDSCLQTLSYQMVLMPTWTFVKLIQVGIPALHFVGVCAVFSERVAYLLFLISP